MVQQTNNHQSGFKRQNTVDSATIKENSARMNARPASAQPKPATENSKFILLFEAFSLTEHAPGKNTS